MKKYKDIPYIVFYNDIGFYCGYVRIPDNHRYNKLVDKKKTINLEDSLALMKKQKPPRNKERDVIIYNGYDDIDISAHGGLTFSKRIKARDKYPQGFTEGAWIGWDYGHLGDKINYKGEVGKMLNKRLEEAGFMRNEKEWTAKEVEEECKNVIDQLLDVRKNKS